MVILTAHMYNKTTPVSANSGSPDVYEFSKGYFIPLALTTTKLSCFVDVLEGNQRLLLIGQSIISYTLV